MKDVKHRCDVARNRVAGGRDTGEHPHGLPLRVEYERTGVARSGERCARHERADEELARCEAGASIDVQRIIEGDVDDDAEGEPAAGAELGHVIADRGALRGCGSREHAESACDRYIERRDRAVDVNVYALVAYRAEAAVACDSNALEHGVLAPVIAPERVVRSSSRAEEYVMRCEQEGRAIAQRVRDASESARHAAGIDDARALSNLWPTLSFGADSRCDPQSMSPLRA